MSDCDEKEIESKMKNKNVNPIPCHQKNKIMASTVKGRLPKILIVSAMCKMLFNVDLIHINTASWPTHYDMRITETTGMQTSKDKV